MCHIPELSAVQVVFGSKLGKMCHFPEHIKRRAKLCSVLSSKKMQVVFGSKLIFPSLQAPCSQRRAVILSSVIFPS